ncbi:MAG: hypothetical protein ACUVTX_10085 [Bacteroidales bacterium]
MRRWLIIFLCAVSFSFSVTRIMLEIDTNIEFDLAFVIYPPPVFPAYYYPTQASINNPQGIILTVGYQRFGATHSVSNIYLATRGSGDFTSTILLNQLYFAPDGEPRPAPGSDPPGGNWRPYSILYQNIEQFPVSGGGLRTYIRPQDFIFKSDADDEPTNSSVTLHYRLYGL